MNTYALMMVVVPLHMVFTATALVGGILFLVWAMRLKQNDLKEVVKWVLAVGIIGAILTGAFAMKGGMGWKMKHGGYDKMDRTEKVYMMKNMEAPTEETQ